MNDITLCKLLLADGADVNFLKTYNSHSSTPLISACLERRVKLIELFLQQPGIQVDKQDLHGYSALMVAAQEASMSVC